MSDLVPITPGATFSVSCTECGAAFDAKALSAENARQDIAKRHEAAHANALVVFTADYLANPLYVGAYSLAVKALPVLDAPAPGGLLA